MLKTDLFFPPLFPTLILHLTAEMFHFLVALLRKSNTVQEICYLGYSIVQELILKGARVSDEPSPCQQVSV